jgi:hypothetical protein
MGGTNSMGSWQQGGQLGIGLNRPLGPLEVVCSQDTCNGQAGACAATTAGAAPILSGNLLGAVVALLSLVGLTGLLRRRKN